MARCPYDVSSPSVARDVHPLLASRLEASGFSDDEAIAIRRGALDSDAAIQAAIAVAREIAANTGYVDDSTWAGALDTGWTDAQLLEVFVEVLRTIFTNYFNHLVGTELDLPAAPALS